MERVKCIRYMEPGNPVFEFVDSKKPESGEVGIKIIASSLCNTSELRSFRGGYKSGYGTTYPMQPGEPGHEAVGKVVHIGENVTGFSENDIVVMTGHGGEPCHRSYVVRKTKDIAVIKPGIRNPEDASMLEMYGCAYHCAMAPGKEDFYIGKRVLVIGLGSMGLCTVQILHGTKNTHITASDICDTRLKIAKESGADVITKPDGVIESYDVIIECSGSVPGQELACRLAPKTLIFSSYSTKEIKIRQNLWFDSNTTIYNPGILTSESFIKTAELYNNGTIDPGKLVSGRINANRQEYLSAIEDIKNGKIVKTLMIW